MIVGNYGDAVFETSDDRILTYRNFRRDITPRFAISDVIQKKPKTEYLGPGLDVVSFEVILNAAFGYNPNKIMDMFMIYARDGHAFPLVIGPKTIGVDKWHLSAVGIPVYIFGGSGEVISAACELTFQEYEEKI